MLTFALLAWALRSIVLPRKATALTRPWAAAHASVNEVNVERGAPRPASGARGQSDSERRVVRNICPGRRSRGRRAQAEPTSTTYVFTGRLEKRPAPSRWRRLYLARIVRPQILSPALAWYENVDPPCRGTAAS